MEQNKLLESMLARAIDAMQTLSEKEIKRLSILDCSFMLSSLPNNDKLATVRASLAQRLCKQLNPSWIEHGNGYQVFSALVALLGYQPAKVTGEHLAFAVQRLVDSEVAVGGPYYNTEGAIAVTANAQIAIFIKLVSKPLPNLDAFLADVITAQHFENTEITDTFLLLLLAKTNKHPELPQYVAQHWQQDDWRSPQHIAVALAILKGKARPLEISQAFTHLREQQLPTGFWDGDPILQAAPARSGSHFITTALVIGVLASYHHAQTKNISVGLRRRQRAVTQAARQICNSYSEPLRSSTLTMVSQAGNADKNFEITLLPHFFAQALETPGSLTKQQQITLGMASLYGWIAYTIYDNFLDGEGKPAELPVANIAMRTSVDCFRAALPNHNFPAYVNDVFTAMEEANAWEVSHCRFPVHAGEIVIAQLPHYGGGANLAARSFAHALAPMAVLVQHTPYTKMHARRIESAFRHYLIARQLNDDIRDWSDDMQAGQASYVVTAILRDSGIKQGAYRLSALLPTMQKRFRRVTLKKICQRILWHTATSRQIFVKSHLLQKTNHMYQLLDSIEQSVEHSLDNHAKIQAFDKHINDWG